MKKPRLMSGARTTGFLHFGNYFGAIKNWVALQNDFDCFFGAMDWHAMTTGYKDVSKIKEYTRDLVSEMVAWGINPDTSVIFVQSQVPEHIELYMLFANITPMGWLERVPTWKDAEEEAKANDTYNLGRFGYPVLQAADIALYRGEKVPVGQDQVSHLEISREIIRRFNHLYKSKLPEPQALLTNQPLVPGLDGRKMSKSYDNTMGLYDDEKSIQKKVKAMPTDPARVRREDPGDPEKCNVYTFHKLFSTNDDLKWVVQGCTTAGIGCGDCKGRLAENINRLTKEAREKKKDLLNQPKTLDSIIADGCAKARKEAQGTLQRLKENMKLL
jgi:tryptophanyl-tRNA synthetase